MAGPENQRATLAELFAGRLRIGEALPWGGLALMHEATPLDADSAASFALAVLPVDCESDPARAARLATVAEAVQRLEHPGLLPLRSHGIQLGVPYFLYAHAEAQTLEVALAKGPMPAADARVLGQALLSALAVAHDAGQPHLDLTPANVLLVDGRLRLLGLGVASLVREVSPDKTGPTGRGSGLDARRFLAPELLRGEAGDARSDVYSVGALLHRAVVGVAPGRPPVPGALLSYEASPGLREVVERALTMEPEARFADAGDMAAALDAAASAPVSSVPPPRGEPLVAPPRDPDRAGLPTGLLLAGALLVLAAALVAMVVFGSDSSDGDPPAAPDESAMAGPEGAATETALPATATVDTATEDTATAHTQAEAAQARVEAAPAPDATGAAEGANEPLAGPLPEPLADALDRIEAGERFDAPGAFDALYGYTRRFPDDPRGYLVLARAFMARGYRSAAFSRYVYAFRLAPERAVRDPHALPDLVDIAARASDPGIEGRVLRLLRANHGLEALPAIVAARDSAARRGVRQRLTRLHDSLEASAAP